jgi:TRAP-type C4-dicarboxylate transport system substrate-binding protein
MAFAGAAQAQTVSLVYANSLQKTHVQYGVIADEWIAKIEKATEGRVKIRHVPGGALLSQENMLDGLRGGIADIGVTNVSNFAGQVPIAATLAGTADIAYGNKTDTIGLSLITLKLIEEFPEYEKEFADIGLFPAVWIPTYTFSVISTKPVEKLADLQGKKIRAFGPNLPKILTAAGATPLSVAVGEVYTSLQTGVIDAAMTDPPNMVSSRWYEVAKNVITTGPAAGAQTMGIGVAYIFNRNSWNKISEQDRKIILDINREVTLGAAKRMQDTGDKAYEELQKNGVTVRHLTEAETAELAKRTPDLLKSAADAINARGGPGTKIIERYKQLAQDYAEGKLKP